MMEFYGVNAYLLEQYIAFKRNLGFALSNLYTFKMFDEFTIEQKAESIGLTRNLARKWGEKRPNESEVNRYKRMNTIINFSIYLNQLGYQSYIPKQVKNYKSTFTPYIFSKEELKSFFNACDTIEIKRHSPMQYILPVIFRFIYGCDRILPMSDTLVHVCFQYKKQYLSISHPSIYYFSQQDSRPYNPDTIYRWFRQILWKAGIPHGGKGKGPRVHDFRHAFSVHSLAEMSRRGLDLYYSLPILSKYLGHNSLEAADKYVRLTSEMYPELIQEVNSICSFVFPEVK